MLPWWLAASFATVACSLLKVGMAMRRALELLLEIIANRSCAIKAASRRQLLSAHQPWWRQAQQPTLVRPAGGARQDKRPARFDGRQDPWASPAGPGRYGPAATGPLRRSGRRLGVSRAIHAGCVEPCRLSGDGLWRAGRGRTSLSPVCLPGCSRPCGLPTDVVAALSGKHLCSSAAPPVRAGRSRWRTQRPTCSEGTRSSRRPALTGSDSPRSCCGQPACSGMW